MNNGVLVLVVALGVVLAARAPAVNAQDVELGVMHACTAKAKLMSATFRELQDYADRSARSSSATEHLVGRAGTALSDARVACEPIVELREDLEAVAGSFEAIKRQLGVAP